LRHFTQFYRARERMNATTEGRTRSFIAVLALTTLAFTGGCQRGGTSNTNLSPGILVEQAGMRALHEEMDRMVNAAPLRVMRGTGLAGALGGVHLKVRKEGEHEVLIPLVQLADTQIPLTYTLITDPKDSLVECALRSREDLNTVVSVRFRGSKDDEIEIRWTSLVLMIPNAGTGDANRPEPFLRATPCVQSDAGEISKLAEDLWPSGGTPDAFAAEIQGFIRSMQQKGQPRSMDAMGILESGVNWICTANANLAAALLRARNVPARTLAVIPVTSRRLEMHRTVEYFDNNQWIPFDPSSLQTDIPLKPWQNIIMAWTTIADEDAAMIPRMGVSLGCPFGHELEFLGRGVRLWGQDFFWTVAKPLVEFEVGNEAVRLATEDWRRFLVTGRLSRGQIQASAAMDGDALLKVLRRNRREQTSGGNP